MLNFKRFFENLLFSESPSFMHMFLEGRYDIVTRPVKIDKNDIRFLQQFPLTYWSQALYQRFDMLHKILKELYNKEISSNYFELAKRIQDAIENPSLINGLIGILTPEAAQDLQHLASKRRYALSHEIPEMTPKEIQIEAEKIAHESLISQKRDDFLNRLRNMPPQNFRFSGGYFNQQKQKRSGGPKTKDLIEASPMLDTLYEKLDKEYGFDLAFPEGSSEQNTAIAEGLKFPSLDQIEQVIKNYLNANYHRLFGELDDKDATWHQHDLQDNRIDDEYLKELKKHFKQTLRGVENNREKSNPKYERMSDSELNKAAEEEAEREFYRLSQSGQLKGAPDPRNPEGSPLEFKKLGINVNQTEKGVEVINASYKNVFNIGDIIKSIGQTQINNIEDYKRSIDLLNLGDKKISAEVERDGINKKIEIKEVQEIFLPPKISLPFRSTFVKFKNPLKHTLKGIKEIEETEEGLKISKAKQVFEKYRNKHIKTINGAEVHTLNDMNEKLKFLKPNQDVRITFTDSPDMQTSIDTEKTNIEDAHSYEYAPTQVLVPSVNPSHYIRKAREDELSDDSINKLGFRKNHVRVQSHIIGTETEAPGSIHLNREFSQRLHKTRGDIGYKEAYEKIIGSMEKCDVKIKETKSKKEYLEIIPNPQGKFYSDIIKGINNCIASSACGGRVAQQAEYAVDNYFILHADILQALKDRLGDSAEQTGKLLTASGRQSFAFTQMSILMGKGLGNVATRRLRKKGVKGEESSELRSDKGYTSQALGRGRPISKNLQDLRQMAKDLAKGRQPESPSSLSQIQSGEDIEKRIQKFDDISKLSEDIKLSISEKLQETLPNNSDLDAIANKIFIGLNYDSPKMQELVERWQYMVDKWNQIGNVLIQIYDDKNSEKYKKGEEFSKIVEILKSNFDWPMYVCHAIQEFIDLVHKDAL